MDNVPLLGGGARVWGADGELCKGHNVSKVIAACENFIG